MNITIGYDALTFDNLAAIGIPASFLSRSAQ
jgi:hypothetical protein